MAPAAGQALENIGIIQLQDLFYAVLDLLVAAYDHNQFLTTDSDRLSRPKYRVMVNSGYLCTLSKEIL